MNDHMTLWGVVWGCVNLGGLSITLCIESAKRRKIVSKCGWRFETRNRTGLGLTSEQNGGLPVVLQETGSHPANHGAGRLGSFAGEPGAGI